MYICDIAAQISPDGQKPVVANLGIPEEINDNDTKLNPTQAVLMMFREKPAGVRDEQRRRGWL